MSVLAELQGGLPRNAPGSDAATARVLSMLPDVPADARILDIGAGVGPQSLVLAQSIPEARITAIDVNEAALAQLHRRAAQAGVSARITTQVNSMHALTFADSSFDLIWSEGAVYIMGFANGLRAWRPFLRPAGYLVVSENTWLTVAPSPDAQDFWDEAYPSMQTLEQNVATAKEIGYELVGTYILPPDAWTAEYYAPLEPRIAQAIRRYPKGSREWKVVDRMRRELAIFRAHGNQYGYVFYALRR